MIPASAALSIVGTCKVDLFDAPNATAEALVKKNQAQNELSAEQIALQVRLAVLAALPAIVEQSVKPLLNIDSIRIAEVGGLAGAGSASSANDAQGGASGGGLSDQVVTSALRYRTNAPLVDALLGEVGLKSGGGHVAAAGGRPHLFIRCPRGCCRTNS